MRNVFFYYATMISGKEQSTDSSIPLESDYLTFCRLSKRIAHTDIDWVSVSDRTGFDLLDSRPFKWSLQEKHRWNPFCDDFISLIVPASFPLIVTL